jgi:hypothetical protein
MSNKYFSGRKGHYIFCDICGQAVYDWDITKLDQKTGRGGLLVCKNDSDIIDYGIVPYQLPIEQSIRFARSDYQQLTFSTPPYDYAAAGDL